MTDHKYDENDGVLQVDRMYNLHPWSRQKGLQPIHVTRAEGVYFWDASGKRYYDMSSQLVNVNVGHGNKKIAEAIKRQVDKLPYLSPPFALDVRAEAARKIVEVAPEGMAKVFFTNAGAESNENAIKMARMVTGRNKIFSRYRSYHGASYGAANLTGEPRRFPCEPGIPGFVKFFDPYLYRSPVPFGSETEATSYYISQLREQLEYEGPENVAAVFLETVTGSNGVIIPPEGYLQGVRDLCDEFGILMVCDEVMCGWGRTGRWFAVDHWGVKPDMITFAKGVTCGYVPLGGVIVNEKVARYFDDHPLMCGLTYSGHPVGCAAAIATIDVYKEEGLIEKAAETGVFFKKQLEKLLEAHSCVGDVRAIGLFGAVELVRDKKTREPLVPYGKDPQGIMPGILGMLKERGFWNYSHENILIVAPPLVITEGEISEALEILDEVLYGVDEGI